MAAQIIDGKAIARQTRSKLKSRIAALKERGIIPGLATVLVGADPASQTYVNSKVRMCGKLGLFSEAIHKDTTVSQAELVSLIKELNAREDIHGILVQSPLPNHLDEFAVTLTIDPAKDVDGFHPFNVGLMLMGEPSLLPCTPHGVLKLLEESGIDPSGKEAVVVGRSMIVGKPVAALLMQKAAMANATVTVAHSRTKNLAEVVRRADIVIAAIGRPEFITGDMLKEGAVVIDVGINRVDDPSVEKGYRIVGDVEFKSCAERASFITPVPGGVGPMTIAMLMSNTVQAAEQIHREAKS